MKFDVVYADPAWKFRNEKTGGNHKSGAAQKYKVMELRDIHRLPVPSIISTRAVLALWVPTALKFSHGFTTALAWDFQHYVTTWYWHKQRLGMGFWGRNVVEELLIFIRDEGSREPFLLQEPNLKRIPGPEWPEGNDALTFDQLLGEHSVKPGEMRDMVERASKVVSSQKKVELFAQLTAPGWTSLGGLVTGQDITIDIRDCALAGDEAPARLQLPYLLEHRDRLQRQYLASIGRAVA